MSAEKTVSVSYRVTPEFKEMLELAAAREKRSRTNLLEWLLAEYCREVGLRPGSSPSSSTEAAGANALSGRSRK